MPLSDTTREMLRRVSAATLAAASFKHGLRHQAVQDVRPLSPLPDGSMVGEAYTLRTIPAREDLTGMEVCGTMRTRSAGPSRTARPAACW